MAPKVVSPAVVSPAVVASPLLQVLPKVVEFTDVENDNELSAVVTVKVSGERLHDQTPTSPGAFYIRLSSIQSIELCDCRTWTPGEGRCVGSLQSPRSFGCKAWAQRPTWHLACNLLSR